MGNARRHAVKLALATAAIATSVSADVVDNTWLGGTGSWTDPTKWSAGVVPNNSGSTTFRVSVPNGIVAAPPSTFTIDSLDIASLATVSSGATFTVNGNVHVDGNLAIRIRGMTVGGPGSVTGVGTISVGYLESMSVGAGVLLSSSTLEIPDGMTVRMAGYGKVGTPDRPLINRGHIVGGVPTRESSNNTCRIAGSTLTNRGVIEANDEVMSLDEVLSLGTFSQSDLGILLWGSDGVFGIGGTLLNQNQTLTVDAAHRWELDSGTIRGGTINIAPGAALYTRYWYGGTLDDVTVNGRVNVWGFMSLNIGGGVVKGNADIFLGGRAIEGPNRIVTSSPTLTINSTVLIHGGGGTVFDALGSHSGIGNGLSAITNHGTIRADNPSTSFQVGEFDLLGTSLFNDGTIGIGSTSFVFASGSSATTNLTFGPGGVLQVDMSATANLGLLRVNGQLDLTTAGDIVMLTAGPQIQFNTPYRVVTASGGVIGQFDSVTPGFEVSYVGNDIFARFVPEPTMIGALGAAILLMQRRRR